MAFLRDQRLISLVHSSAPKAVGTVRCRACSHYQEWKEENEVFQLLAALIYGAGSKDTAIILKQCQQTESGREGGDEEKELVDIDPCLPAGQPGCCTGRACRLFYPLPCV